MIGGTHSPTNLPNDGVHVEPKGRVNLIETVGFCGKLKENHTEELVRFHESLIRFCERGMTCNQACCV
jgi:hypothetical protein